MRKYLISEKGNFYKANLHCHTIYSDGALTPEEVKKIYTEKGYSIVAFTDHDVMIPHHELTDESFLALTGYEMENNEEGEGPVNFKRRKSCHMCFIALDKNTEKQVCYHRTRWLFGNAPKYRHLLKYDENIPDFEREYTHECISEMMKTGRDNGFFVTYNHPCWSMEFAEEYLGYNGMHAMEIYNHSSAVVGFDENNSRVYEDMLRAGKRIYCIAADDNHNHHPIDSPRSDACGGFTMIKAEKLEYNTVTDALMRGDFYASNGPEIYSLYFEDGYVCVECSPAAKICAHLRTRRTAAVYPEADESVTSARFKCEEDDGYIRITVHDKNGKYAATSAYFCDELYK